MNEVKKAQRRIARQLDAIDQRLFRTLLGQMLSSYGVPYLTWPLHGLPQRWDIRNERRFSDTGAIVYGIADSNAPCFFVPGIMHGARKHPFELVVLHTHCHEMIHFLGRRRLKPVALHGAIGKKADHTMRRFVFGFQINTIIEADVECGSSIFHYFNEGVTELLARELLSRCAYRLRLNNVGENDIDKYLGEASGFYATSVAFVESLIVKFALGAGVLPQTVLNWLVQAYVRGTDLRTDKTWHEYVEQAKLPPDFTKRLENASEQQLQELRAAHLLPKVRLSGDLVREPSVFDDIEVKVI